MEVTKVISVENKTENLTEIQCPLIPPNLSKLKVIYLLIVYQFKKTQKNIAYDHSKIAVNIILVGNKGSVL